jgi:hypothetical protein
MGMFVPFFSTQSRQGNIRIDFCKGNGYTDYESAFIETLSNCVDPGYFYSKEVLPAIDPSSFLPTRQTDHS